MKVYIASDHGGFEKKQRVLDHYQEINEHMELVDLGPFNLEPNDDFPDYGIPLAEKVASELDSFGILICRSGNGMVIAANKVLGAYAALCFSPKHAEMARRDDNANIVSIDADYQSDEEMFEVIKRFLETLFSGGDTKYARRFNKIQQYEREHFK